MKLTDRVYLVGSGLIGLSHACDCNVYLIDGGDNKAALIDAGSGVYPEHLIYTIQQDGFGPDAIECIINTHTHWDHARGDAFMKEFTHARLVTHALGVEVVERTLWSDGFLAKKGIPSRPTKVDRTVQDGDKLQVGKVELTFFHTPGHSDDGLCILMEEDNQKLLFSGDTVLAFGTPGVMFAERADLVAYRDSVQRLASLKVDALLPGHNLFVLANGHVHVQMLADKLAARWWDLVPGVTPAYPSWWLEKMPELYDDAR